MIQLSKLVKKNCLPNADLDAGCQTFFYRRIRKLWIRFRIPGVWWYGIILFGLVRASVVDPGSKRTRIPFPDPHQRISILTQKNDFMLSALWSGLLIKKSTSFSGVYFSLISVFEILKPLLSQYSNSVAVLLSRRSGSGEMMRIYVDSDPHKLPYFPEPLEP